MRDLGFYPGVVREATIGRGATVPGVGAISRETAAFYIVEDGFPIG